MTYYFVARVQHYGPEELEEQWTARLQANHLGQAVNRALTYVYPSLDIPDEDNHPWRDWQDDWDKFSFKQELYGEGVAFCQVFNGQINADIDIAVASTRYGAKTLWGMVLTADILTSMEWSEARR